VSELALDHDQRNALMRHLDCVRMTELVRREPTSYPRRSGCVMQLLLRRRGLPTPAGGWPVDHAQQRSDRELAADLEPRAELFPGPAVHTDLAPLAAFPASDEHRAAAAVKIALLESERFADPQPRAPQQDG
jgi:hypothetical protein